MSFTVTSLRIDDIYRKLTLEKNTDDPGTLMVLVLVLDRHDSLHSPLSQDQFLGATSTETLQEHPDRKRYDEQAKNAFGRREPSTIAID